jgi:hypothetical protein
MLNFERPVEKQWQRKVFDQQISLNTQAFLNNGPRQLVQKMTGHTYPNVSGSPRNLAEDTRMR